VPIPRPQKTGEIPGWQKGKIRGKKERDAVSDNPRFSGGQPAKATPLAGRDPAEASGFDSAWPQAEQGADDNISQPGSDHGEPFWRAKFPFQENHAGRDRS
jgi:hypothetical protein